MSKSSNRRENATLRFAVVAADGRRSREWTLWTHASGRPSDETYLAPRDCGNLFKISLHAGGQGQIGLGERMRNGLASIDRRAVDRWRYDPCSAYTLYFSEEELTLAGAADPRTLRIPAPMSGTSLELVVVITDTGTVTGSDLGYGQDWSQFASLPRANGGTVRLLGRAMGEQHDSLRRARQLMNYPYRIWELPEPLGINNSFGIYTDVVHESKRRFATEVSTAAALPVEAPRVFERFRGRQGDWAQMPISSPPAHACACVRLEPDGSELVFVNPHMRCEHENLFSRAHDVLDRFASDGPDGGWTQSRDGGWLTWLVTPELFDRELSGQEQSLQVQRTGWTSEIARSPELPGAVREQIRETAIPDSALFMHRWVHFDSMRAEERGRVRIGFYQRDNGSETSK